MTENQYSKFLQQQIAERENQKINEKLQNQSLDFTHLNTTNNFSPYGKSAITQKLEDMANLAPTRSALANKQLKMPLMNPLGMSPFMSTPNLHPMTQTGRQAAFNSNPLAGLTNPMTIPPVPLMGHLGAGMSGFAGYRNPNLLAGSLHMNDRIGIDINSTMKFNRGAGINSLLTGEYLDADRLKKTLYRNDLLTQMDDNKLRRVERYNANRLSSELEDERLRRENGLLSYLLLRQSRWISTKEYLVIREKECIELMKIDINTRVSGRAVSLQKLTGQMTDLEIPVGGIIGDIHMITQIDLNDRILIPACQIYKECINMIIGVMIDILFLHQEDGQREIFGIMAIEKHLGGRNEGFGKMVNGSPQMWLLYKQMQQFYYNNFLANQLNEKVGKEVEKMRGEMNKNELDLQLKLNSMKKIAADADRERNEVLATIIKNNYEYTYIVCISHIKNRMNNQEVDENTGHKYEYHQLMNSMNEKQGIMKKRTELLPEITTFPKLDKVQFRLPERLNINFFVVAIYKILVASNLNFKFLYDQLKSMTH